jgi:phosphoribulokinase
LGNMANLVNLKVGWTPIVELLWVQLSWFHLLSNFPN